MAVRFVVASAVLALTIAAATPPAAAGPSILFDPTTGEVVSQDRAGQPWYPASITKIMTAYLAFEELHAGRMKLDQKIRVSQLANNQAPSKIGVPPGSMVTVDFALQALLIHSANDMAIVLAEAVAGTTSQFVQRMNATAQRLGMTATKFVNPNGLHNPQQVSSARDIAVLAAAAFNEFPQYRHYYRQDYLAIGKRRLRNTNALLRLMASADGMKTGFTCPAGFNLVATASEHNRRLMAVVLGAPSGRSRAEWAQGLLVSGFASAPSGARLGQIANLAGGQATTDMSGEVCGRGGAVPVTAASSLKGHGASLGRYLTRSDAKQVLDTWKGDAALPLNGVSSGVVRLADPAGFAAMVWDIDETRARSLCTTLSTRAAHCTIMTPDNFTQMAAAAAKSQRQGEAAQEKKAQEEVRRTDLW